jgi:hypothetical protein
VSKFFSDGSNKITEKQNKWDEVGKNFCPHALLYKKSYLNISVIYFDKSVEKGFNNIE